MARSSSAQEQSEKELRGYGMLEVVLGVGLVLALGLAAIGIGSPGWLSIQSAFTATAVAIGAVGLVAWLTLERVRRSFNQEIQGDSQESANMRHALDVRTSALQESHAALAQTVRSINSKLDKMSHEQKQFMSSQDTLHSRLDSRISRVQARLRTDEHMFEEVKALDEQVDRALHSKQSTSLSEMEGISESYLNRLHQEGIFTSADLLAQNSRSLANKIQAFPGQVQSWQVMAQLMELHGVGPQFAEVLEASGIHSVDELAKADPQELIATASAVSDGMEQKVPGISQVRDWIKQAKVYQPGR